jgi:hypothetical protein
LRHDEGAEGRLAPADVAVATEGKVVVDQTPAAFSRLALELCSYGDRAATAAVIAERGMQTVQCGYAAVVRAWGDGLVRFEAVTASSLLVTVERIANETGEGPAFETVRHSTTILMDDSSLETRWPRYRAGIGAQTDIRSALTLHCAFEGVALGAIAFYDQRAGWFTDERIALAEVFADHATIALAKASQHDDAAHLKAALTSNRFIGYAVGILMATYRMDQQQSFDLLRQVSNHTNRPVLSVAEEVIHTGALPDELRVRLLRHDPR